MNFINEYLVNQKFERDDTGGVMAAVEFDDDGVETRFICLSSALNMASRIYTNTYQKQIKNASGAWTNAGTYSYSASTKDYVDANGADVSEADAHEIIETSIITESIVDRSGNTIEGESVQRTRQLKAGYTTEADYLERSFGDSVLYPLFHSMIKKRFA